MQNYGDVFFGITHGLVYPCVRVAAFGALHFQMDGADVSDNVRAVGASAELLASSGRAADRGRPLLRSLQLTPLAL